jgi:hypothetical protein
MGFCLGVGVLLGGFNERQMRLHIGEVGTAAKAGISDASAESASRLIQESIGVPPQEESITPMGTCSRWLISRAKK